MTELQLESYFDSCYWDFVTLYDGSSEDSDVLHTYCTSDTSTFTSTGSSVLVVFQTDKSVNSGRFSLSWTFAGGQGKFFGFYFRQGGYVFAYLFVCVLAR